MRIGAENMTRVKPYGEHYRKFVEEARLPDEYLDGMYGSKYAQHYGYKRHRSTGEDLRCAACTSA